MTSTPPVTTIPEAARILERDQGLQPWTLWGSYLPDRQWGTVREDYSAKDHELAAINSWGDALMHCFGASEND